MELQVCGILLIECKIKSRLLLLLFIFIILYDFIIHTYIYIYLYNFGNCLLMFTLSCNITDPAIWILHLIFDESFSPPY